MISEFIFIVICIFIVIQFFDIAIALFSFANLVIDSGVIFIALHFLTKNDNNLMKNLIRSLHVLCQH